MFDNETYACPIMTEKELKSACILSVGSPRNAVMMRLACESFFLTPFMFSIFASYVASKNI